MQRVSTYQSPGAPSGCRSANRAMPVRVRAGASAHAEQVHHEHEGLAAADRAAGALLAVTEVRRDRDAAPSAHPHAGHPAVPAPDHLAGTEPEHERVASIPRGVELLPRAPGLAHVV